MTNIHEFATTDMAYDACMCDEDIHNGDILLIKSEGVVGIADTWPFAVTLRSGELHNIPTRSGKIVAAATPSLIQAQELAASLGFPLHGIFN